MKTKISTLPPHSSCKISFLYNKEEIFPLTEEIVKYILENIDKNHSLRISFSHKICNEILEPLVLLKHKFNIIFEVKSKSLNISIKNPYPQLFLDDIVKQIIISLFDIIKKLYSLIELIKSKYICLFNKTPLNKLIKTVNNADPILKDKYLNLLNQYNQLSREFFKLGFTEQGLPFAKNFDKIKNDLFDKSKAIKAYRDKIAAHIDLEDLPNLPEFQDIKIYIDYLVDLIFKIHFLATYTKYNFELKGEELKTRETIKWFMKGIHL